MNQRKIIKDVDFLIFMTFVALFFPQFKSYFDLFFEQLLTAILFAFSFFFLFLSKKIVINTTAIVISFVFLLLLLISVVRSLNILIVSDLFELAKPIYFFLFYLVGYNVEWNTQKIIKYFSFLMFFLLLAALIGIGEAVSPAIDKIMAVMYKGTRSVLSNKAVFSFISPYTFGTVLILPIFYYFIKIIQSKTSKIKMKYLFTVLIFLTCFIFTQSKTSLISFVLTFLILFFIVLFTKWFPTRRKLILSFLLVFLLIVLISPLLVSFSKENLNYLYNGLNVVFSKLDDFDMGTLIYSTPSISLRYEQLVFAVENQDFFPLIGVGIGKSVLMPESFYAMYYYRVGIIGMCLHFGIILYSIQSSFLLAKRFIFSNFLIKDNAELTAIFLAITIYFISFFFSYFSSAVNDQTRSGFIFYVIVGILCKYWKLIANRKEL